MNLISPSPSVGVEKAPSPFPVARRMMLAGLLREPLLHFLVIGSLIFAVHAVATPSVGADRLIEVTPEVRQSIIDLFKNQHEGEAPSPEELTRLIDVWILNEVTYRDALRQGLDKGDEMIRERIMQKMRLLVFSNVVVNEPTVAELEKWFEANRTRYDVPDVLSFFDVPFTGASAEANARETLELIETGNEPEEIRLKARAFVDRPRPSLEAARGKAFVDQLAALPVGKWQLLRSPAGWHVVRLDSFVAGRRTQMHEIQTQLANEWKDRRARVLGTEAIKEMAKSYVIERGDI